MAEEVAAPAGTIIVSSSDMLLLTIGRTTKCPLIGDISPFRGKKRRNLWGRDELRIQTISPGTLPVTGRIHIS